MKYPMVSPMKSARHYMIILVHGTWGRGLFQFSAISFMSRRWRKSRWFEESSAFYQQLTKQISSRHISHNVCSFLWSGANSVLSRDQAAKQLASLLDRELS